MKTPQSRRAFSLVELLIVILIIALVIAIVLPALGHARKSARNAATRSLMGQIQTACSSFILSERRMPGYFSAKELGSTENATRGFTGMENVMFDLAGGNVTTGGWAVGPVNAHLINYDPAMVGVVQAGSKAYFTPPAKYFKFQNGSEGGTKAADANHINYIRDLVDAEGTPILFWGSDSMSVQPVTAQQDFARQVSDTPATAAPSRFYWTSNAAFLNSTSCGEKRYDQLNDSLLGGNMPNHVVSMIGVLGNPNSPNNVTNTGPNLLPTAPRGAFVLQAAGTDCVFTAKGDSARAGDRGGKIIGSSNVIGYDMNFRSQPSSDLMKDFDDILVAGG